MLVPINNQPVQQDLAGVNLGIPLKSPDIGTGKDFQEALLQDLNRQDTEDAAARAALMGVAIPVQNGGQVPEFRPDLSIQKDAGSGSPLKGTLVADSTAMNAGTQAASLKKIQTPQIQPIPGNGTESQPKAGPEVQDGVLPELMKSLSSDGVDVSRLENWQNEGVSFEGLKVVSGEDRPEAPAKESAPQSWSTQDFLSLRFSGQQRDPGTGAGMGQDASKESLPGVKKSGVRGEQESREPVAFAGIMDQNPLMRSVGDRQTLEAPVMRAPSGQIRLSDEAVGALAGRVNSLSQARQDGEIKIRLRPDHLGELVMNVRTQGQQVSLQIKATDGESKKILEDSLSALRDSLSQQNLSLSKVEVVSGPAASFATPDQNPNLMSDSGSQRHDFGGQGGGFSGSGSDRDSGQERRFDESVAGGNLNQSRAGRSVRNRSASGLDLIA